MRPWPTQQNKKKQEKILIKNQGNLRLYISTNLTLGTNLIADFQIDVWPVSQRTTQFILGLFIGLIKNNY